MGVNRLSKLLTGDAGQEEFSPEEQVHWLTGILILRLFGILALGGLAVVWASQLDVPPAMGAGAVLGLGLVLVLCDTVARRHARSKACLLYTSDAADE